MWQVWLENKNKQKAIYINSTTLFLLKKWLKNKIALPFVDVHFLPKLKPKASNFALRAQGKQSPVVYGGPVVYRGRIQKLMTLGHQIKPKPTSVAMMWSLLE